MPLLHATLAVQKPEHVVGTGDKAWSYLVLEAEDYDTKQVEDAAVGFTRVDAAGAITSSQGNPVLGKDTTASNKGALFTQTAFSQHGDKVTYSVQFARPGTYYLYMRFTMFENGGNLTHYLNEDSFFVPPDWGKDPQVDWPLSDRGGYAEGCCDTAGFLYIKENGVRVNHSGGDEAGRAYWEGNFHWNELLASQFLNAETQGEPGYRFRYIVTPDQVGKPLNWTVSYREGGVTIDLFLFSTNPNLMEELSQSDLDRLLVKPANLTVQDPANVIGTGDKAWSYLILEGENFASKAGENPEAGFRRVDDMSGIISSQGSAVLGTNTTASGRAALYTQTAFAQHSDKVTYNVEFTKAGTYYVYMRFSMFENGGNVTHYLNEDSFFLPPDWGKDPQTDWPLSDRGGYVEGCCDTSGFLYIKESGGKVNHGGGDEAGRAYWEGNFHWNELVSSQFLNAETQGAPAYRFKYEVTEEQVGKPLTWTISYREGGVTVDLFLFSTNPNLMDEYSQSDLDRLLLQKTTVTVQDPKSVVGSGDKAWSYVVLEGENYARKSGDNPDAGFRRVGSNSGIVSAIGNPVLGPGTTASGGGALFTQTGFAQHSDKVTYNLEFTKAGTYYVYMRFTMFENGGNATHYLNEDSFFLPPDWAKDPQTDWPLSDRGGYVEGCCDTSGFLYIRENGVRVNHGSGDEAGRAYWEGNFHWNDLVSSQFLNPETQGTPNQRFSYVVTEAQVGQPLPWTISYREGGVTVDLFLFSTNPNLMDEFTQDGLEGLILHPSAVVIPSLAVGRSGGSVVVSWPDSATGFVLQSTPSLSPGSWSDVADAPVVAGGQKSVTIAPGAGGRLYRLAKP